MQGSNPGLIFLDLLNGENISIKKMQYILGHKNIQSIQKRISNFKAYKGWIKTYINYCNSINFNVHFIINNKDNNYIADNIGKLLEEVRLNDYSHLTKDDFSKNILDLSNYTYTLNSFNQNNCSFEKFHTIFNDKLEYNIEYLVKKTR